jgi:C_GCAxxG_C_C family probable redox protein
MKKLTLEERLAKVAEWRKAGYNCSQCVFMAFSDVHGIPEEQAARISGGLGGGVGGQHEVCGAVSAMSMVLSSVHLPDPSHKKETYSIVQTKSNEFKANNGSIVCADLLADRPNRKPCAAYIEDAIRIIDRSLE